LLNRRGTTWRKLPAAVRENINAESARALMLDNQSIIKRPLLADGDKYLLGFSAASYPAHLGTGSPLTTIHSSIQREGIQQRVERFVPNTSFQGQRANDQFPTTKERRTPP